MREMRTQDSVKNYRSYKIVKRWVRFGIDNPESRLVLLPAGQHLAIRAVWTWRKHLHTARSLLETFFEPVSRRHFHDMFQAPCLFLPIQRLRHTADSHLGSACRTASGHRTQAPCVRTGSGMTIRNCSRYFHINVESLINLISCTATSEPHHERLTSVCS